MVLFKIRFAYKTIFFQQAAGGFVFRVYIGFHRMETDRRKPIIEYCRHRLLHNPPALESGMQEIAYFRPVVLLYNPPKTNGAHQFGRTPIGRFRHHVLRRVERPVAMGRLWPCYFAWSRLYALGTIRAPRPLHSDLVRSRRLGFC